jgi:hypothetical protein
MTNPLENPYGTAFGLMDQVYGPGSAKALIAAAVEGAAEACDAANREAGVCSSASARIRALTPADAKAALDRMLQEAVNAKLREAARVAGDAAVASLLRRDPKAGVLRRQLARQAISKPIRALIQEPKP